MNPDPRADQHTEHQVVVIFDVVAGSSDDAHRAIVAQLVDIKAALLEGRVTGVDEPPAWDSWWMPEPHAKQFSRDDNGAFDLIPHECLDEPYRDVLIEGHVAPRQGDIVDADGNTDIDEHGRPAGDCRVVGARKDQGAPRPRWVTTIERIDGSLWQQCDHGPLPPVELMQTFVASTDLRECADVLDPKRKGKQRVENIQIIRALTRPGYGWTNHPAVRMWRGHVPFLWRYHLAVCRSWLADGHHDTCLMTVSLEVIAAGFTSSDLAFAEPPPWWGGPIHQSHRDRLVDKMPAHYGPIWPDADPTRPYVWPPDPTLTRST